MAETANKIGESSNKKVINAIKFRESAIKRHHSRQNRLKESKIEDILVKRLNYNSEMVHK